MKMMISTIVFAVGLALTAGAAPETWTGQISDSHCGVMHKPMGNQKMSDRECTEMCIKGGGKYVFVLKDKVYQIVDQKDPALVTHAGHTVQLTGELKGDTITVSKIEMEKK